MFMFVDFVFLEEKSWLINDYCKTSCGLIQDGLFTNWKILFAFDPRLHGLQRVFLAFH